MDRVRILLLLVVGVLAVGCGGATATGSGPAATGATGTAGASADGALYGELTTVDGEQLDGAAYRNADLALWFWAPW